MCLVGFDEYNQEMLDYCVQDCKTNLAVYNKLLNEINIIKQSSPNYDDAIAIEHKMSYWTAKQVQNGWQIDEQLLHDTMDKVKQEITDIEQRVEPQLGTMKIFIDKEPKTPKYKKNGEFTAASARILSEYFGFYVDPSDALRDDPPIAPGTEFQRSEVVEARLGNQDHLKKFLETIGWKPTQWNWKRINGEFIKISPKLTTDSLLPLGDIGKDIDEFFTLRARHSVLTGWLEHIKDGRLYGDVMDYGAATGRQTHKIIANVPSPKAKYGTEIRSMFVCPEDKVLISADGASYQARIAAHFAKDAEFSHEILKGDIHQKNADAWQCDRATAKPALFALFFGCGAAKLARILGVPEREGKTKMEAYRNRWPSLTKVTEAAKEVSKKRGWLKGLDGRRMYVEDDYKGFNYLIQGTEALLMKRTLVRINDQMNEEGIDFKQLLYYHDEVTYEINPKDANRVEEIIRHWFAAAPKELGVNIMEAGDVKVGVNYYDVH